jgi:AbrB family looped-hinge helix DNA binding protein
MHRQAGECDTSPACAFYKGIACHYLTVMVFLNGMKDALVPIDKAGRVVLPKDVRDELALNPGDLLKISVQGDQVTLRPNRETTGFVKRGGALIFSTSGTDLLKSEAVEAIRDLERDRLSDGIGKGLPQSKHK